MTLAEQVAAFTQASADGYPGVVEPVAARVARLRARAPSARRHRRASCVRRILTGSSPPTAWCRVFEGTLRGLGIASRSQSGVVLDLEPRPSKTPRAFCAPARVPDEVYLVLSPGRRARRLRGPVPRGRPHRALRVGGAEPAVRVPDASATTRSPSRSRSCSSTSSRTRCGSREHLGLADADAVAAHGRAARTLYLRRYCAKFTYELELHDQPPELPPARGSLRRTAERRSPGRVVGESYLADVDPGFYSSCYLRAWALETHLRRHLVDRFGPALVRLRRSGRAAAVAVEAGSAAHAGRAARRAHRRAARSERVAGRPRARVDIQPRTRGDAGQASALSTAASTDLRFAWRRSYSPTRRSSAGASSLSRAVTCRAVNSS